MHNWWLAALEHFELITHEEALHVAANIKNSIHKDDYEGALRDFEGIIKRGNLKTTTISSLKEELDELRAEVYALKKPVAKTPKV